MVLQVIQGSKQTSLRLSLAQPVSNATHSELSTLCQSFAVAGACRNNGGGHLNHSFFWQVMGKSSDNNGPSSDLKGAIDSAFGSLDELKTKFNAAAAGRFGSGWAWLVVKPDGDLAVTSTPNQDNPLVIALTIIAGAECSWSAACAVAVLHACTAPSPPVCRFQKAADAPCTCVCRTVSLIQP